MGNIQDWLNKEVKHMGQDVYVNSMVGYLFIFLWNAWKACNMYVHEGVKLLTSQVLEYTRS